jgi:hypothetical protein
MSKSPTKSENIKMKKVLLIIELIHKLPFSIWGKTKHPKARAGVGSPTK